MFPAIRAGRATAALGLCCALLLTACDFASALDPAEACLFAKMKAAASSGARMLRCAERFPAPEQLEFLRDCRQRVRTLFRTRLAAADDAAMASGYSCPATPESLGVQGPASWPQRLVDEMWAAGSAGADCTRQRIGAVRRYAKAASHCRIRQLLQPDADEMTECIEDPRQDLLQAWNDIAARTGDCIGEQPLPDVLVTRLRQDVEAQAQRLTVTCGDRHVAGYEECDDGGTVSNDGCTFDCRIEQCARVQSGVVCAVCADDAILDPQTGACRCPDGYQGTPGSCADIDECAADAGGCPAERPCVNLAGTHACAIPCTEEALHEALAACGAPTGAIAFNCKDQVIQVARGFIDDPRRVMCDDLVIDGAGSNLTFEMDPLCWKVPLPQERCRTMLEPDGTCACPDVDTGTPFLILEGDRNVVRNLTVRGFFDGIRSQGSSNVVEDVRFERMCDDAFGSMGSGTANVFRNLEALHGCDKCSESDGDLATTDTDPRVAGHYSAIFENVRFEGCLTPLRLSRGGRYRIRGVTMTPSDDPDFPCDGPRFSGMTDDELAVEMDSSVIQGCRRGIRFGILSDGLLWDNIIHDNTIRGVRVAGDARVALWDNSIRDNGGDGSTETGYGGVTVLADALADLGGGPGITIDGREVVSPGGNALCGNLGGDELPRDVENETATVVPAENNWWCTYESPADLVFGHVDYQPFLKRAP
ncbi:MAG TPA: hypothetical protein VEC57_10010 [Candidatus Limnocylindrales bacterium]|nr:hypothetical protein [Candidatus Limnocylindrales bacterium]